MTDDTPDPRDSVEYHSEADTYRVTYSHDAEPPSTVIVEAIQEIADCGIHDLDPLYTVLNPTALDELFQPTIKGGHRGEGRVHFRYHEYKITVKSCGIIVIQEDDTDESSCSPI